MSAENKKIVWIVGTVLAAGLVLAGLGFLVFAPKKGGSQAPATIGNTAAPKSEAPQDFLSVPAPSPDGQGRNANGDIVVVYGDKPTSLSPTPADSTAAPGQAGAAGAMVPTQAGSEPVGGQPGAAPDANAATASTAVPASSRSLGAKPAQATAKPAQTTAKPAQASVKPAAKPGANPAASAAKTPAKAVQPAKKAPELWIQVASFSSRGKADELKDGLAQKGVAALITVTDIKGKSWYRVRIGPYSAKAEADGWLAKVKAIPGCEEAVVMK